MIRTIIASALLLATGGTAEAQWRSIRMTDDATGQPMVLAQAEGSYGRLRVVVHCREVSTSSRSVFTGDTVFANGTLSLIWGDGPGAEQHCWEPDGDYEVLYLTTWAGGRGAGAGYDPASSRLLQQTVSAHALSGSVSRLVGPDRWPSTSASRERPGRSTP